MVECGAFNHLNRKIELIRGELCEMNPAGPLHDDLITYLNNWSVLSATKHGMIVTSQTGLSLPDFESRPEPDLLWLRRARYQQRHPGSSDVRLAIEVSYSSLQHDLEVKADLYAEAKIVEYWIVDADSSSVHMYREPHNREYTDRRIATRGETVSPLAAPDAKLDLSDLFATE